MQHEHRKEGRREDLKLGAPVGPSETSEAMELAARLGRHEACSAHGEGGGVDAAECDEREHVHGRVDQREHLNAVARSAATQHPGIASGSIR